MSPKAPARRSAQARDLHSSKYRKRVIGNKRRAAFLADVSHELMTPLSAIRGYVETLSMPEVTLDDETRGRYLDVAKEETYKLARIIGDLLDLARLEGGGETLEFDTVLVDDLFRRVCDRHRPCLADRGITLNASAEAGTPLIWGDADRLEQAGIGSGIATPRTLDRALVDGHHPGVLRHRTVYQ